MDKQISGVVASQQKVLGLTPSQPEGGPFCLEFVLSKMTFLDFI